jgi:hypothetical protein
MLEEHLENRANKRKMEKLRSTNSVEDLAVSQLSSQWYPTDATLINVGTKLVNSTTG